MKRTWMHWLAGVTLSGATLGVLQADPPTIDIEEILPVAAQDVKKADAKPTAPPGDLPESLPSVPPVLPHGFVPPVPHSAPVLVPPAVAMPANGRSCANGNCGRNGCPACSRGGFYGEVGIGLKPYWPQNPGLVGRFSGDTGPLDFNLASQFDLEFDGQFVPSGRVGFTSRSGTGARLTVTDHVNSATTGLLIDDFAAVSISSAGPLGVFISTEGQADASAMQAWGRLELQVFDLEVTQSADHGTWSFLLSGGLRYAHLEQNYSASRINLALDQLSGILRSRNNFTGVGLTLAAELNRKLGSSGLALYSDVRGSLLYGDTQQHVFALSVEGPELQFRAGESDNERFMPIGELEVGVMMRRSMGRGEMFFKLGLVGQAWHEAGNSSRSTNPDVLGPVAGGTVDDAGLGFFGFVCRGGFGF